MSNLVEDYLYLDDELSRIGITAFIDTLEQIQVNGVVVYISNFLTALSARYMGGGLPLGCVIKKDDNFFIVINHEAKDLPIGYLEAVISHEQGHIALGHFEPGVDNKYIEYAADRYAKSKGKDMHGFLEYFVKLLEEHPELYTIFDMVELDFRVRCLRKRKTRIL